jgi:hypothetical protein
MKRWIVAVAILMSWGAGLASADYVVIIANLGQVKESDQQPGLPGVGMIGGFPGGVSGPGAGGMGAIGGRGGLGQFGVRGGMGQLGGVRGGGMIGEGRTGGGMGQFGGRGRGGFQPPGGPGGVPGPGGAGVPGPGGFGGGFGGFGELDDEETPHYIVAVVEMENRVPANPEQALALGQMGRAGPIPVKHRWGSTHVLKTTDSPLDFVFLKLPSVQKRFELRQAEVFKGRDTPDPEAVLSLAEWALTHGLVKQFTEVMDKLAQDAKAKEHPAVKAYEAVKAALARPITKEDAAAAWRARLLEGYQVFKSEHYAILHNSPTNSEVEVKTKRDRLENSFASFFYWFALKGVVPQVPQERQVGVLTKQSEEFDRYHDILTAGPVVANGFFCPRENMAIVSAQPLNEKFRSLEVYAKNRWWENGYDRQVLLQGRGGSGAPANIQPTDLYTAQSMALLVKAMEHDAERATVSHFASRQLLFASGLLPRGVTAPEWALFGMGSFFETPLESPWASLASPSTAYLPQFNELLKKKKLEATATETLKKVVTDSYFRRPSFGQDSEAVQNKARATAWSLTYYLAQKRLNGLQQYFKELARMPRDLELDNEVLLGCFARAFGCVDADQKVDPAKLDALAQDWFSYMRVVLLESEEVMQEIRKHFKEMNKRPDNADGSPGTTPGGRGAPGAPGGGRPGGPGGPGGS